MQASLAVATLLFLLSPFSAAPFTTIQSTGSTVAGAVVDTFQAPLSAATITLYSVRRVLQTKSDRLGRFEVTEVPDGSYHLEVVHSGFLGKAMDISVSAAKPEDQARRLIALDSVIKER